MTARQELRVQVADSEVTTPPLRRTARRAVFWIVVIVVLTLIGVVSLAASAGPTDAARLSATNAKPNGAQALIKVLDQDGVITSAPRTLSTAIKDASVDVPSTTVVIYDPTSILSAYQLGTLGQTSPNLVLIEPSTRQLSALAPGITRAGAIAATASAGCNYGAARRAGTMSGLAQGYHASTDGSVQRCFESFGAYGLIRAVYPNETVTVLGTTTALTNQSIASSGNAALALGLFGSTKRLVWYRPSFADHAGIAVDGRLPAPPWVTLTAILIGLVFIAAGIWRGRRLGPMVVERMPVTVRASETLDGRARLYQRASARTHALDMLRVGTISRLGTLCGQPTVAPVDAVIGAVASVTGRPVPALRALLVDDEPASDSQLIRMSDDLRLLEDEVARQVTPR